MRSKKKPYTCLLNALCDNLRRNIDLDPQRRKHITRPALARDRPIPMLSNSNTSTGNHKRRSGRYIERTRTIPASTACIDKHICFRRNLCRLLSHDADSTGDFIYCLTLHAKRAQKTCNLRISRTPVHYLHKDIYSFLFRKITAFHNFGYCLLYHDLSPLTTEIIFSIIFPPTGVSIDSG